MSADKLFESRVTTDALILMAAERDQAIRERDEWKARSQKAGRVLGANADEWEQLQMQLAAERAARERAEKELAAGLAEAEERTVAAEDEVARLSAEAAAMREAIEVNNSILIHNEKNPPALRQLIDRAAELNRRALAPTAGQSLLAAHRREIEQLWRGFKNIASILGRECEASVALGVATSAASAMKERCERLTTALEKIDYANRVREDSMRGADDHSRAIRDLVIAALSAHDSSADGEIFHCFECGCREQTGRGVCYECVRAGRLKEDGTRLTAVRGDDAQEKP